MATENDILLIHFEDKPMTFARIEEILPDAKPNWYHVKMLLLQVPLQVVTWILRDIYIDGAEFTMNGSRMRLERVVSPEAGVAEEKGSLPGSEAINPEDQRSARVISLTDRKKN
ncbi:MAG: hypothetical protein ACOWWM_19135 [Desulfobacterales bacterium]